MAAKAKRGSNKVRVFHANFTNDAGVEIPNNKKAIAAYVKRGYTVLPAQAAPAPKEAKPKTETVNPVKPA